MTITHRHHTPEAGVEAEAGPTMVILIDPIIQGNHGARPDHLFSAVGEEVVVVATPEVRRPWEVLVAFVVASAASSAAPPIHGSDPGFIAGPNISQIITTDSNSKTNTSNNTNTNTNDNNSNRSSTYKNNST